MSTDALEAAKRCMATGSMDADFFRQPILNSPYDHPSHHWELDGTGQPTGRIIDRRWPAQEGALMPRAVLLTAGAERDLASIYDFIADATSESAAERVLHRLLEAAERLREFPERVSHPAELLALGIRDFRQVMVKPYRIIYRAVNDGRRDMQTLLAQRLLTM